MVSIKKSSKIMFLTLSLLTMCIQARDFQRLYEKSNLKKQRTTNTNEPTYSVPYLLSIQTPSTYCDDDFETVPSWRVYFHGSIVQDLHGSYQLIAPNTTQDISLVVGLLDSPKTHTLDALSIAPGKTFAIYSLHKKKCADHHYTWDIEKQEGNNGLSILPFSIIVLMEPTCIKTIKPEKWKANAPIIPLPTLILDEAHDLQKASDKSMLQALEIDTFHEKIRKKNKLIIHEPIQQTSATQTTVLKK